MKFVEQTVLPIIEKDPFKKIELCARTCYKSEDKIIEDSALRMYNSLIKNKHFAMTEHATFCIQIFSEDSLYSIESTSPFLRCTQSWHNSNIIKTRNLVSGNLRALNDLYDLGLLYALYKINPVLVFDEKLRGLFATGDYKNEAKIVDINNLPELQEYEKQEHTYHTLKFICDRGIGNELVRHRRFSFAQESSRYCSYDNDRFGREITYIIPLESSNLFKEDEFKDVMQRSEISYMGLLNKGYPPEIARAVLPMSLKTEVVMTGNESTWDGFFDLRHFEKTGKVHPNMKDLATKAYNLIHPNNQER